MDVFCYDMIEKKEKKKRVLHGKEIVKYLQNYKHDEVKWDHSFSYRVLQVTCKWKTFKKPVYF